MHFQLRVFSTFSGPSPTVSQGRSALNASAKHARGRPPGRSQSSQSGVPRSHLLGFLSHSTWLHRMTFLPSGHLSPVRHVCRSSQPPSASMTTKAHRGLQDKGGKWLGSSQEPLAEETGGQDRRTQLCTGEDGALRTGETQSSCVCAHECVLGGHSRKSTSWGYVPGVPSL